MFAARITIRFPLFVLLLLSVPLFGQSLEREHAISHPDYEATYGSQGRDAVATDGERFYVVWRKGEHKLMLTRFAADGSPIDPFGKQLAEFSTWVTPPAIVWNGAHFMVFWTVEGSLFGSPLTRDGTLLTPEGVLLASDAYAETDGTALISYTRFAEEPPFYGEQRGFTRLITHWELPQRRRGIRRF